MNADMAERHDRLQRCVKITHVCGHTKYRTEIFRGEAEEKQKIRFFEKLNCPDCASEREQPDKCRRCEWGKWDGVAQTCLIPLRCWRDEDATQA
ncbi:hypothetical protein J6TS7_44720 [Paenibacillus dendritiformis]|nr:hypothetical protein [Paenibacillus phage Pd_22F]GIO80862.1 hypothetical protein J6TS7_44720 [Paenibacillus dendritiformis]